MAEPGVPGATRIAIKFGNASSGPSKKPTRPKPSSTLGKRPRPSHGLGGNSDSDSDSENDRHARGRHERITAFGADGAELESGRHDARHAKPAELVIAKLPDRDWRGEAKARRQGQRPQQPPYPPGADRQDKAETGGEGKPIKWGLTITDKAEAAANEDGADPGGRGGQSPAGEKGTHDARLPDAKADSTETRDADTEPGDSVEQAAVQALLGETVEERTKTRHVIESAADTAVNEEDVFRRDFREAPEASTLEDYEAMPVEEFGAALLRGMGWDGKDRGPKVKEVKRRPNQLGLGAKELKGSEDLGAWGNPGAKQKQRPPKLHEYRREEEKRREQRTERHRDSYKSERERERARERDRGRYDQDRDRNRDRDRDRDRDGRRDRDRDGHGSRHAERHRR